MVFGKSEKNFEVDLKDGEKASDCSEKDCSIMVSKFPLFSGKKRLFIELEMDVRFSTLRSSRESIEANECLDPLLSDPILLAREFNYTFLPSEITYLDSIKELIPCGSLNSMFFFMERDFVFRKSSTSFFEAKQELLPNFSNFAIPENSTLSHSFYSWANMLRHSSRSQYYIGELDEDLPKVFSINFRRGAKIGLRRNLRIIAENTIKSVLGLMLIIAGVTILLLGIGAHFLYTSQGSVFL